MKRVSPRAVACIAVALSFVAGGLWGVANAGTGLAAVVAKGKGLDASALSAVVEAAATEVGWKMSSSALTGRAAGEAASCVERDRPLPCLAPIMAARSADRLVFLDVGASPDDAGVLRLSAIVVLSDSSTPAAAERFCRSCKDEALRLAAGELVRSVIRDAEVASGRTALEISATPEGAWVYLDGEALPVEPRGASTYARAPTYPGEHVITVEKSGFHSEVRKVTATADRVSRVSVTLRSLHGSGPAPDKRRRRSGSSWQRPAAWALLGAGAAAAATGVVLIALDEDLPAAGSDEPRRARYFDSAGFGTGLAIGGGVAAAAGVAWLLLLPERTSGAAVSVSRSGAAVSWSQAF